MNKFSILIFSLLFIGCNQSPKTINKELNNSMNLYNSFDSLNHLQPEFDKIKFDTLHRWDFGWALIESMKKANIKDEEEINFTKKLSPGQKALYFYWYLDEEVTNGGFIQFYWNGYRQYLSPIKEGLKLIVDTSMYNLVEKADKEYIINKDKFDLQIQRKDWSPLYENIKTFDIYDSIFYKIHNSSMDLFEKYIRKNSSQFIKFK